MINTKNIKSILSLFLVAALALSFAVGALGSGAAGDQLDAVIRDTADYIIKNVPSPAIGQIGGEWAVFSLVRSGVDINEEYIADYYSSVADELADVNGVLSVSKFSEYSRVAISMISIGADPRDIGGFDMLEPLIDFESTVFQGINGPIFALIALDASGHDDNELKNAYIEHILSRQLEDGGFTLAGTISDPDTTGMVLTALSRHAFREDVADAVGRALNRLSTLQRPSGGFTSYSSTNSESVAQVIIALSSLGIPIDDERFTKEGNTLLDNLLTYYSPGQGFEHERDGGVSLMATEQALCALVALQRAQSGGRALFDLVDAPTFMLGSEKSGLMGKHPDIAVPVVSVPEPEFEDITGDEHEAAIKALFEREIITGDSGGSFEPHKAVTRAEFAELVIRALGLKAQGDGATFKDVAEGSRYYDSIHAAAEYGIILGRSADVFDPNGLITRQEASIIIRRAASLCGIQLPLDDVAVRNILSQFIDYRTAAPWAAEALAFCSYFGIIDDNDIELRPKDNVLRGESASMVYRLLQRARLV